MLVRGAAANPRLAQIVRHYQSRTADLADTTKRIALPARTDVFIEFYFTSPHLLELQANRLRDRAPWVAAVGPQTHRRVDLLLTGRLDIFNIIFTPTGLHALTGMPMPLFTDAGLDAEALFGPQIRSLHNQLADATDLHARARIADAFLLNLLDHQPRPTPSPIVTVGLAAIRRTAGSGDAQGYATAAGASGRHFRRIFEQQVGVAPKLYARIIRVEAAIRAREQAPERSWTDIAHAGGWFDQPHMDNDFRALTGAAPTRYRPATRDGRSLLAANASAQLRRPNDLPKQWSAPMSADAISPEDRSRIEALLARQEDAWNRHDMTAFVADMTEDVDWINVVGMHWQGRETVQNAHAALHRLPLFAASRLEHGTTELRRLSADTILVVGHSRIENAGPTPDGGAYPDAGAIQTLVLIRAGDDWKIAHGHTTNKLARALAHDPSKR